MISKKATKGRVLLKIAKRIGESSANNCWGWYHQPKVPASLKNENSK